MAPAKGKNKVSASKKRQLKLRGRQLLISRVNPDHIRSVPVNDMVVTHSQNEFFITFTSLEPPPFTDAAELQRAKSVEAITRAKITAAPEFVEIMIKVLNTNLATFRKQAKAK
jgi:hypothetical protein